MNIYSLKNAPPNVRFLSNILGALHNRNFCNRLIDKYKDLCKSVKLHPHKVRAFFCTNALHNAGYSIEQVANQAGHSSLNTTREYIGSDDTNTLLDLANNL